MAFNNRHRFLFKTHLRHVPATVGEDVNVVRVVFFKQVPDFKRLLRLCHADKVGGKTGIPKHRIGLFPDQSSILGHHFIGASCHIVNLKQTIAGTEIFRVCVHGLKQGDGLVVALGV